MCCWEDVLGNQNGWYCDDVSLEAGQLNFATCGAYTVRYRQLARLPRPEEARAEDWLTISEHRQRLATEISRKLDQAWRGVRRGNGVTLHQMVVLDDYGSIELQREVAKNDPEVHWQQIEEQKLWDFADSLTFLDAEGYRFYIPAFLRSMLGRLAQGRETTCFYSGVWYSLDGGTYHVEYHYPLLSTAQKNIIATFLQAFQNFGDKDDRLKAWSCLKAYWHTYVAETVASPFQD